MPPLKLLTAQKGLFCAETLKAGSSGGAARAKQRQSRFNRFFTGLLQWVSL
jgi:hypothetical protein